MLDFLFRRLTAEPPRGAALFDAVTRIAREPHWYVEGAVPDILDGRFAVLATVTALVLVRLESDGEDGDRAAVALTERFIEVMESEHRELGIGDPALGKKVRTLVGSLARRTDRWREAVSADGDWASAARDSLYKAGVAPDDVDHSTAALRRLWARLGHTGLDDLEQGNLA
jgi:cytochrome b pre-mRNA-processing protein 3